MFYPSQNNLFHTLKKQRLKITQLEKMCFIEVNEIKLTQVELFEFFHFICVAPNASEFFVWLI